MQTINWTRAGQTGSKKVQDALYEEFLASFRRAGYTIVEDATVPAQPVAPAAETEQTGRVGKGLAVHKIVAGHSVCGASWRRNSFGSAARTVRITGETVTCRSCH